MKELDFSGISTEKLENAIQRYDGYACSGISCHEDSCPFRIDYSDGGCKNVGKEREHRLFKEELKRREEKEMNKMPELKAGMIIKGKYSKDKLYLYVNEDWAMCLNGDQWISDNVKNFVTAIYKSKGIGTYEDCAKHLELIWSKKSDTQIKIDELSETINKANIQIEELRKGLK